MLKYFEIEEMFQLLRALDALAKDSSYIPRTQSYALHPLYNMSSGEPPPPLGLRGH